jgi:small subunit ribosomal protein S8
MNIDTISDTLTRIRNAQRVNLSKVDCRLSNTITKILDVLQEEGYINGYKIIKDQNCPKKSKIQVKLKYYNLSPVIQSIDRVSKPGLRVYSKISSLTPHNSGLGIYILSTPAGIMSDRQAREKNVGGEVICKVF